MLNNEFLFVASYIGDIGIGEASSLGYELSFNERSVEENNDRATPKSVLLELEGELDRWMLPLSSKSERKGFTDIGTREPVEDIERTNAAALRWLQDEFPELTMTVSFPRLVFTNEKPSEIYMLSAGSNQRRISTKGQCGPTTERDLEPQEPLEGIFNYVTRAQICGGSICSRYPIVYYERKVLSMHRVAMKLVRTAIDIDGEPVMLAASSFSHRAIHILAIGLKALFKEFLHEELSSLERLAIRGFSRDVMR